MAKLNRFVTIALTSAILAGINPAHGKEGKQTEDVGVEDEPRGRVLVSKKVDTGRTSAPAAPEKVQLTQGQIMSLIDRAAKKSGVEAALVHAIVEAESRYDTRAVSRAGAIGLMQIMPKTAKDYGVSEAKMLFDPAVNVDVGIRHLKRLLAKYRNDFGRVIMAYNAGEGTVDRTNSQVSYIETLGYAEAVIANYRNLGGTRPTESVLKKVALLRRQSKLDSGSSTSKKNLDRRVVSPKSRPIPNVRYVQSMRNGKSAKSGAMLGFRSANQDNAHIRSTFRRVR